MRFSTKAVHAGEELERPTGTVVVPVYQVSTYRQLEPGVEGPYVYSRSGNPTRTALENSLASLEGARYGLAFASGMGAITTVILGLLRRGDHVISVEDLYGGTRRLFDRTFRNFGVEFTYVEGSKAEEFEKALRSETKMVWVETPTNPLLKLVDLESVAKIAHEHSSVVAVDNTFMSPYLQQPLKFGADIAVHSTTKYLGGHSDLVGGGVALSDEEVYEKLRYAQNAAGAIPGPWDCWLVLRGIKTLAVRMDRHCTNAQRIAEFLNEHEKAAKVLYPGLKSHPQHELARKQMAGFGGMVSFYLKGNRDSYKNLLKHVEVFTVAESLGSVESLIEHPSSMTHASLPKEIRESIGVTDSLIRLSIGIEDVQDLIEDLSRALDQI